MNVTWSVTLVTKKKGGRDMEIMVKVECALCGGRYYVVGNDLPRDLKVGEAFPNPCPFCGPGNYAVLIDENSN